VRATFNDEEVQELKHVRLALLATAAVGLMAIAAPASAQQVYLVPDGHYYRLVPVKKPLLREATEMVTGIPGQATADVTNTSNCRLDSFYDNEYQPKYVTMCGPR
jgi:hypothetical protein